MLLRVDEAIDLPKRTALWTERHVACGMGNTSDKGKESAMTVLQLLSLESDQSSILTKRYIDSLTIGSVSIMIHNVGWFYVI